MNSASSLWYSSPREMPIPTSPTTTMRPRSRSNFAATSSGFAEGVAAVMMAASAPLSASNIMKSRDMGQRVR